MSENGVVLYYRNRGGELVPSTIIPVDDFLKAADYYCENRDSELKVAMAMTKPHGVVNIYSPYVRKSGKRRVVTNLRNDFVPLLLELPIRSCDLLRKKANRNTLASAKSTYLIFSLSLF